MTDDLEAWRTKIEERVASLERRLEAPSVAHKPTQTPSPREFLLTKGPKGAHDLTLAAGYYLEVITGKDSFDLEEIRSFYGQAKEASPANPRDPPFQNVKKGYFREVGKRETGQRARNRWALTNLGIKRVEDGFRGGVQ